jgi:ribose 5-phosphate isomerase B
VKIAVGSDHAGYNLKEHVRRRLGRAGHEVVDLGTDSTERVDYPVYGVRVAKAVAEGRVERGILVCGTSIGIAMAANRVRGCRAAPCMIEYLAEMARRHNDANVLALGERVVTPTVADRIVDVFLKTEAEGGRHARRVKMMDTEPGA